MANLIREDNNGVVSLQAGDGVPNHISIKTTLFFDISTATIYINKNGSNSWASLIDSTSSGSSSSSATTIYNGNGSLSGNRTVNTAGFTLNFSSSTNPNTLVLSSGRVGLGILSPSATLHLRAGGTTGSTAPLKFTTGSYLSSPESGAMEWDGNRLYITDSAPARQTIAYLVDIPASNNITTGQITRSGDGLATVYTIEHGIGDIPSFYMVQAGSLDAANISYVTVDSGNIYVHYMTSPLVGSDNVVLIWAARI